MRAVKKLYYLIGTSTFAALILALFHMNGATPDNGIRQLHGVISVQGKEQQLCEFNRISVSPSGHRTMAFSTDYDTAPARQSSRTSMLLDNACLERSGDWGRCSRYLTGTEGARFLGWRNDGTAIMYNRDSMFSAEIDPRTRGGTRHDEVRAFDGDRLIVVPRDFVGTLAALAAPSRLPVSGSNGEPVAEIWARSKPLVNIVEDTSSLALRAVSETSSVGLRFNSAGLGSLFTGDGHEGELLSSHGFSSPSDVVWSKQPLRRRDGGHGSGTAQSDRIDPDVLDRSSGGRFGATIFENAHGVRKFEIRSSTSAIAHSCGPETKSVAREVIEIGDATWRLRVLRLGNSTRGRVAVMFLGGPIVNPFNVGGSSLVKLFLKADYEIFVVGYSGSTGSGAQVTDRLRTFGPPSIGRDVKLVEKMFATKAFHIETPLSSAVIYGESFGAIPAMILTKAVPGSKTVLVAPLLVRKSPDVVGDRATSLGLSGPSRGYQTKFEDAVLGPLWRPAKVNGMLAALQGDLVSRPPLILLARDDVISEPADVDKRLRYELFKGSHQTLVVNPRARAEIVDFISR